VPKFEEFGYTVPATWEDFLSLAQEVSVDHPGYIMAELDNWATNLLWYVGSECPMMNPVSDTMFHVNFLDPNCQRVSKLIDDLNALGVLDTNGTFSAALGEKWKAGEWLTWIGPVWEADFVIKGVYLDPENPENEGVVGMAPMPKWKDQDQIWTGSVGGAAWAMSRHTVNPELAIKLIVFATTHPMVTESAVTLSAYQPGGDTWARDLAGRSPLLAKDPDPYETISIMAGTIWPDYKEGPPVVASVFGPIFLEIQAGNKTAVESAEDLQNALVDLAQQAGYEVTETGQ
jgi:ABC-type glycerol-3-phosphate transport system substrate-binding protein